MKKLSQQTGFSLLEVLLVLVCMAAIISWSMHHYQVRQRRAQTIQIESDIKSLQRALDTYFHTAGCDSAGNFQYSSLEVSCQTLQPYDGDLVCSRPPLVSGYSAELVKTDQSTQDNPPKPIYQLRVQAELSNNLSSGQVSWYQQQLQAKIGDGAYTLIWDSLPANSYVQLGDQSWILSGAGESFRANENQRGAGGTTPPKYSGSFCAN